MKTRTPFSNKKNPIIDLNPKGKHKQSHVFELDGWEPVYRLTLGKQEAKPDIFLVRFEKKETNGLTVSHLHFRLGIDHTEQLGWEKNHHILLCHDKKNPLKLALTPHIRGYKLTQESPICLKTKMRTDFLNHLNTFGGFTPQFEIDGDTLYLSIENTPENTYYDHK